MWTLFDFVELAGPRLCENLFPFLTFFPYRLIDLYTLFPLSPFLPFCTFSPYRLYTLLVLNTLSPLYPSYPLGAKHLIPSLPFLRFWY